MYQKSLEITYFRAFRWPGRAASILPKPPMERMKKIVPTKAIGCTIEGGHEAKAENYDRFVFP